MATYQEILDLINVNLQSGTKIPATKHRQVEIALLDYIQANLAQSGDIKPIKADTNYLNANFDANGLGKNLRLGWAICNGNNGTPNIGGRTIVGYGTGFTTLNAIGGSKDAVLVSHSHSIATSPNDAFGYATVKASSSTGGTAVTTSTVGESGIDKNMQPYIVQLYIMKL
jgi:hypothetical protein